MKAKKIKLKAKDALSMLSACLKAQLVLPVCLAKMSRGRGEASVVCLGASLGSRMAQYSVVGVGVAHDCRKHLIRSLGFV